MICLSSALEIFSALAVCTFFRAGSSSSSTGVSSLTATELGFCFRFTGPLTPEPLPGCDVLLFLSFMASAFLGPARGCFDIPADCDAFDTRPPFAVPTFLPPLPSTASPFVTLLTSPRAARFRAGCGLALRAAFLVWRGFWTFATLEISSMLSFAAAALVRRVDP